MVNLDILQHAWTAITELCKESSQNEEPSSLVKFKVFELPNCTIIAFFTWPANSKDCVQGNEGGDFVSSSTLKNSFPVFNFLCPKDNQEFSINKPAFQLFSSNIFGVLPFLKSKVYTPSFFYFYYCFGSYIAVVSIKFDPCVFLSRNLHLLASMI